MPDQTNNDQLSTFKNKLSHELGQFCDFDSYITVYKQVLDNALVGKTFDVCIFKYLNAKALEIQ